MEVKKPTNFLIAVLMTLVWIACALFIAVQAMFWLWWFAWTMREFDAVIIIKWNWSGFKFPEYTQEMCWDFVLGYC